MSNSHSDALIIFGATGDLAYKKIFPALEALVKRGRLNAPVIGVARSPWTLEQFRARALESLEKHGGVDPLAFRKLSGLLRYVSGEYNDPATFNAICQVLEGAQRPAYYLAIPPFVYGAVAEQLARTGCLRDPRIIVEKPFGRDLTSARELNRILHSIVDESAIFRIDHFLGKRAVHNMLVFRFANTFMEAFWNRNYIESIEITMAEKFGVEGRGAFYDEAGTIRDVVENHLFQVLSNLAMEPPINMDSESVRDEKVKVMKAVPPIAEKDVIRGQFRGYLDEKGVAKDSKTETFAALRMEVNSWRWQGVPFYIRAGKYLPVTCTEVVARFRKPPAVSLFNVLVLNLTPDWVRAGVLTITMLVFQGGMAAGSATWGAVAAHWGIHSALLWSGLGTMATASLGLFLRLPEGTVDLTAWNHWKVPATEEAGVLADDDAGPVLVTVEYDVIPERTAEFIKAMHAYGRIRRRDGASRWGIFRDIESVGLFVETFIVTSWAEHLRQLERMTEADRELEDRLRYFVRNGPTVRHLIYAH